MGYQRKQNREGTRDLHTKKHKSYSGDDLDKASSSNHQSDIKKYSDIMKRKISLD